MAGGETRPEPMPRTRTRVVAARCSQVQTRDDHDANVIWWWTELTIRPIKQWVMWGERNRQHSPWVAHRMGARRKVTSAREMMEFWTSGDARVPDAIEVSHDGQYWDVEAMIFDDYDHVTFGRGTVRAGRRREGRE